MTIMVLAIIGLVTVLIILALIGLVIWQKRFGVQVHSLHRIERQLEELGNDLCHELSPETEHNEEQENFELPEAAALSERRTTAAGEPKNGLSESGRDEDLILGYNVGKSGKIYTERELEALIKE